MKFAAHAPSPLFTLYQGQLQKKRLDVFKMLKNENRFWHFERSALGEFSPLKGMEFGFFAIYTKLNDFRTHAYATTRERHEKFYRGHHCSLVHASFTAIKCVNQK